MINPFYFIDRAVQVGFNISLDSPHINHANSVLSIKPNYSEIEIRDFNKIFKKIDTLYARLMNQCKFNYQTIFSARFDKQDDDGQI